MGLIPRSGRSPGEGNGNPLQYSCLENSMDRGTWRATVHGARKSRTQLSAHVVRIETVISHKDTKKLQLFFKKAIWTPFHGPRPGVTAWWSGSCSQATTAPTLVTIIASQVNKLVTGPQSSESRHLTTSEQSCFCHLNMVTPAGDGLCPILNFLS